MLQAVDSGGYAAADREFKVARVTSAQVQLMLIQRCPLGFAQGDWDRSVEDLCEVLAREGLSDADVRLQGSSARFFSFNPKKPFPQDVTAVRAEALAAGMPPDEVVDRWRLAGYDQPGDLPFAHFFDSRRHILFNDRPYDRRTSNRSTPAASPNASDYDLQISSDLLVQKIMDGLRRKYPDPDVFTQQLSRHLSPHGGHFRPSAIRLGSYGLIKWAEGWTDKQKRLVNLAAFPSSGPAELSAFKPEDWRILCPPATRQGPRSLARGAARSV